MNEIRFDQKTLSIEQMKPNNAIQIKTNDEKEVDEQKVWF